MPVPSRLQALRSFSNSAGGRFRVLGLQQIAIGSLDKQVNTNILCYLQEVWVAMLARLLMVVYLLHDTRRAYRIFGVLCWE